MELEYQSRSIKITATSVSEERQLMSFLDNIPEDDLLWLNNEVRLYIVPAGINDELDAMGYSTMHDHGRGIREINIDLEPPEKLSC
jgi:hypothetical protein